MSKSINEKIRQIMDEKSISTRMLAEMTGIPKSAVQRYSSGTTETIPLDRVRLIASSLQVNPAFLSGWEDEESINIYGNHKYNLDHFKNDPELLSFYQDMHNSENLKLLFDTGRELTPDELEKVLRYMNMVMDGSL